VPPVNKTYIATRLDEVPSKAPNQWIAVLDLLPRPWWDGGAIWGLIAKVKHTMQLQSEVEKAAGGKTCDDATSAVYGLSSQHLNSGLLYVSIISTHFSK
jgi:hypothetical protein